MPEREVDEQVRHDHIVQVLYRRFYHYPDDEHPHLITFTNHPVKTKAVKDGSGHECFPDLVVVNAESGRVVMIVEVETENTVVEEERQEWQRFSGLGDCFYLYVPKGLGQRADILCRDFTVKGVVQYYRQRDHYVIERFR